MRAIKILYIEDHIETSELIPFAIYHFICKSIVVRVATNVDQALEALKDNYDLIISDVNFLGYKIVEEALNQSKGAPVVVYSSEFDASLKREFLEKGAKRYFEKVPEDTQKMLQFIQQLQQAM